MVVPQGGPGGPDQPWCCQQAAACEHRNPKSLERVTAVAAAVAAVASGGVHDGAAASQLEALNLMLPRAVSAAMGCKAEAAAAAAAAHDKTEDIQKKAAAAGVLHGYEALRAMKARAHEFRKGYHNWRRHQAHGARGDVHDVFIEEDTTLATQQSSSNGTPDWSVGGSSLESAGILMYSRKIEGLVPAAAAPPSASAEVEALDRVHAAAAAAATAAAAAAAADKPELTPSWLRFFFNPHTPLLSNGVWPLRRDFLPRIAEKASVPQYPLESSTVKCWIAHVGVGGFHRSHQCVFFDELLHKTHAGIPDDLPEGVHKGPWGVCGIGLLPGDKRMSDVLHEQEFLYTGVYTPQTAVGLIYFGLKLRRSQNVRPFTVLSCDNIPNNGKLLKKMVIQFASEVDVEMATWISKHVCFPCTMVDRITPVTSNEHVALLEEDYGVGDKWPVVAEDFKQWVIGDNFCNERPFFEAVGCLVVRDVQSYEEMKLKLLNGGHSAVAYVATLLGYRFVDEAIRDVRVSGFLRSFMDEVTPCLEDLKVDVERYKEKIVERFGNAFIKDELQRVAQDGSNKFYNTTRTSILYLLNKNKNILKISISLAAWILYFSTKEIQGCPITHSDPKAEELRRFALAAVERPYTLQPVEQFLNAVYGLPAAAACILSRWVCLSLASLIQKGVAATLDAGGALEGLLANCFGGPQEWSLLVNFCSNINSPPPAAAAAAAAAPAPAAAAAAADDDDGAGGGGDGGEGEQRESKTEIEAKTNTE